jgi:hypothetical protein
MREATPTWFAHGQVPWLLVTAGAPPPSLGSSHDFPFILSLKF